MSDITDLDTAKELVKQFYPNAKDPALEDLLGSSKSLSSGYRPYAVAAYFIMTEYRRIAKADEVTFDYNTQMTVDGLLRLQKAKDCNDPEIDPCWSVDTLLGQLQNPDNFTQPSAFVL